MNNEFKDNAIINLTFEFSLKVIDFCEELENLLNDLEPIKKVISKIIGTSKRN
jgi:hypothetical protein